METKGAPAGNLEALEDTYVLILSFNTGVLAFDDIGRSQDINWSKNKCQYRSNCEHLRESIHESVK